VYGKRATDGRPYEMRGKRGKCVGAVIGRPQTHFVRNIKVLSPAFNFTTPKYIQKNA